MYKNMESCQSGRSCSTRNAVSLTGPRVRIPDSPPDNTPEKAYFFKINGIRTRKGLSVKLQAPVEHAVAKCPSKPERLAQDVRLSYKYLSCTFLCVYMIRSFTATISRELHCYSSSLIRAFFHSNFSVMKRSYLPHQR